MCVCVCVWMSLDARREEIAAGVFSGNGGKNQQGAKKKKKYAIRIYMSVCVCVCREWAYKLVIGMFPSPIGSCVGIGSTGRGKVGRNTKENYRYICFVFRFSFHADLPPWSLLVLVKIEFGDRCVGGDNIHYLI